MADAIDPSNITDYEMSDAELERFIIFTICVAGKTAFQISYALRDFLEAVPVSGSPFEKVQHLITSGQLRRAIKRSSLGKHGLLEKALRYLVAHPINLRTASWQELEQIPGIGPKSSRFFILHSREGVTDIAALDTHVLHFLSDQGHNVPRATPTGKRYSELEQLFLRYAHKSGKSVAEFDLEIWNRYARKPANGELTGEYGV